MTRLARPQHGPIRRKVPDMTALGGRAAPLCSPGRPPGQPRRLQDTTPVLLAHFSLGDNCPQITNLAVPAAARIRNLGFSSPTLGLGGAGIQARGRMDLWKHCCVGEEPATILRTAVRSPLPNVHCRVKDSFCQKRIKKKQFQDKAHRPTESCPACPQECLVWRARTHTGATWTDPRWRR